MRMILITIFLQPLTILAYVLVGSICLNCKCKEMKHLKSGILPGFSPHQTVLKSVSLPQQMQIREHTAYGNTCCVIKDKRTKFN